MLILIDIGNSNITTGIVKDGNIVSTFRLTSDTTKNADEYYLLFKNFIHDPIDDAIISSVSPLISSSIIKMIRLHYNLEPKILGNKVRTGVNVIADDPKSVGSDLICDVAGASLYFDEGLIIDLGTASKFIYYKDKTFKSVSIAPGVATSTKALINSAALLNNFELIAPTKVLNNSTNLCLQSGVIFGFASMVDGMIRKIKKELKKDDLKIVLTGGLAKLICPHMEEKVDSTDNDLLLKGLLSIYLKNI